MAFPSSPADKLAAFRHEKDFKMIDDQTVSPGSSSPLSMVLEAPAIHRFIAYLTEKKRLQEDDPQRHLRFEVSRQFLEEVRAAFRKNILKGERHLHHLAHILSQRLFSGDFELHSNVLGLLPYSDRPFLIRERITDETLLSETDIDLGNHLLANFRYQSQQQWVPLYLSANFIEYLPRKRPTSRVSRITSRVKAEEEIWNKVADEIFDFDALVNRDKHLRQFSKYIKDVFGLKLVCEDVDACLSVFKELANFRFRESDLQGLRTENGLHSAPGHDNANLYYLEILETKDYLTCDPSKKKKTGWEALKTVVRWGHQLFEIQVQPLVNYYLEVDHMAAPSHRSFKQQRDALRDEVAQRVPLYGFYRELLKMLFLEREVAFQHENASVVVTD
jgi:hypothetical protein